MISHSKSFLQARLHDQQLVTKSKLPLIMESPPSGSLVNFSELDLHIFGHTTQIMDLTMEP